MGFLDFLKKDKWKYVMQGNLNMPIWTSQKDKQFITEGFNSVVWVYSCVGAISSAVSSVPWLLYRKTASGRLIEIEDHPILTMLNVRANPYMSSKDFLDYWATYLAIEGKFYAEYSNPTAPTALYPIYPHYVYPIPHKTEFIGGFEYRMGEVVNYNPNELLWSKFNDPLDVYQGQSPIRALSRTIDTENEAVNWNKTTLQNAGVPAGVFQVQNPSPELSRKLEEEWTKRYGGGSNARKPLILNSDKASYLPIGLSPLDMDFLNQRKINRIEICSAFGVPSQIVGDPEGQTYSNYGEAQKAFWENTIISKYLDHMKDKLQQDLLPRYANNLVLKYDLSSVGALKENEDKKSIRVNNLWKSGLLTKNESRYALDYSEVPDGDVFYNEIVQLPQMNATDQTKSKELIDAKKKEHLSIETELKAMNMNESEQKAYWKSFDNQREKFVVEMRNSVESLFSKEKDMIIASFQNANMNDLASNADNVIDSNKDTWTKIYFKTDTAVITEFGNRVANELAKTKMMQKSFNPYSEAIKAWIAKNIANAIVQVTDTTKREVRNIIQEAIDLGYPIGNEETPDTISFLIGKLYLEKIIPNRSEVIARTEVITASNHGSLESAKQSGAKLKKIWISTPDSDTRDTHRAMDNKPAIDLNALFKVGESYGQAPADPKLSAKERINCRCTIGYEEG
jgi:HK97 family phage portal protein